MVDEHVIGGLAVGCDPSGCEGPPIGGGGNGGGPGGAGGEGGAGGAVADMGLPDMGADAAPPPALPCPVDDRVPARTVLPGATDPDGVAAPPAIVGPTLLEGARFGRACRNDAYLVDFPLADFPPSVAPFDPNDALDVAAFQSDLQTFVDGVDPAVWFTDICPGEESIRVTVESVSAGRIEVPPVEPAPPVYDAERARHLVLTFDCYLDGDRRGRLQVNPGAACDVVTQIRRRLGDSWSPGYPDLDLVNIARECNSAPMSAWSDQQAGVAPALPGATAQGVAIAVIDTGLLSSHGIAGNVCPEFGAINNDAGHGTAVAEVARRAAPGSTIFAYRGLFTPNGGPVTDVALAMERALNEIDDNAPLVINLSLGWAPEFAQDSDLFGNVLDGVPVPGGINDPNFVAPRCVVVESPIGESVRTQIARAQDRPKTLVVAAAGNRPSWLEPTDAGGSTFYPAAWDDAPVPPDMDPPYVLGVDQLTPNQLATPIARTVSLVAPGFDVDASGTELTGTSLSTAYASGATAQVLAGAGGEANSTLRQTVLDRAAAYAGRTKRAVVGDCRANPAPAGCAVIAYVRDRQPQPNLMGVPDLMPDGRDIDGDAPEGPVGTPSADSTGAAAPAPLVGCETTNCFVNEFGPSVTTEMLNADKLGGNPLIIALGPNGAKSVWELNSAGQNLAQFFGVKQTFKLSGGPNPSLTTYYLQVPVEQNGKYTSTQYQQLKVYKP